MRACLEAAHLHPHAQVDSNSQGYVSGSAMNTAMAPPGASGSAAGSSDDASDQAYTETPDNGAVDESLAPGQPQPAGEGS